MPCVRNIEDFGPTGRTMTNDDNRILGMKVESYFEVIQHQVPQLHQQTTKLLVNKHISTSHRQECKPALYKPENEEHMVSPKVHFISTLSKST